MANLEVVTRAAHLARAIVDHPPESFDVLCEKLLEALLEAEQQGRDTAQRPWRRLYFTAGANAERKRLVKAVVAMDGDDQVRDCILVSKAAVISTLRYDATGHEEAERQSPEGEVATQTEPTHDA